MLVGDVSGGSSGFLSLFLPFFWGFPLLFFGLVRGVAPLSFRGVAPLSLPVGVVGAFRVDKGARGCATEGIATSGNSGVVAPSFHLASSKVKLISLLDSDSEGILYLRA